MEFGSSLVNKDVKRSPECQVQAKEESEGDDDNSDEEEESESEDSYSEDDNKDEDPDYKESSSEDSDYQKEIEKKSKMNIKTGCVTYTPVPKVKVYANEKSEDNDKSYEVVQVKQLEDDDRSYEEVHAKENSEDNDTSYEVAKIDLAEAVQIKRELEKRKFKEEIHQSVLRKSRRLANISTEDYLDPLKVAEEMALEKIISPVFSFKDVLYEDPYDSYVADMFIQEPKYNTEFITYHKADFVNMTVTGPNVVRTVPTQITALSWYPSPEQLIVATSDRNGNLAVVNMNSKCRPYLMKVHSEDITKLQFNPFNQVQIISSSYDGKVRCGDMVQHMFNEIYNVSSKNLCTYFDILSETTFLVAQDDGCVAVVDTRSYGRCFEKKHTCHENCIISLSIHPVNRNIFISAGESIGSMRMWDLRNLQIYPVVEKYFHRRVGLAAYFSPVTGNSVLTTTDMGVSIWDCSDFNKFELKQQIEHKCSMWKYKRATWLPYSEEDFVIGGNGYQIKVYDKNMFSYSIHHKFLATVPCVNVFHPRRLALASGNYGKYIYLFT